jgi:hypothetical protein
MRVFSFAAIVATTRPGPWRLTSGDENTWVLFQLERRERAALPFGSQATPLTVP